MENSYPAPWTLNGDGYIFLYRFPRSWAGSHHWTAEGAVDQHFGGLGTVMLVDYQSSTAGPYRELLFCPGRFSFGDVSRHSITKIFVSTMESVVNGRRNWGIPKELADFIIEDLGRGRRRISVVVDGTIAFRAGVCSKGFRFPVNTALMPLPLAQRLDGKYFYTRFNGKGMGRFARIDEMYVNPELFPEISKCRPIVGIGVDDFTITFPEARVKSV